MYALYLILALLTLSIVFAGGVVVGSYIEKRGQADTDRLRRSSQAWRRWMGLRSEAQEGYHRVATVTQVEAGRPC